MTTLVARRRLHTLFVRVCGPPRSHVGATFCAKASTSSMTSFSSIASLVGLLLLLLKLLLAPLLEGGSADVAQASRI